MLPLFFMGFSPLSACQALNGLKPINRKGRGMFSRSLSLYYRSFRCVRAHPRP